VNEAHTPSQTAGPLFGFALLFDGCEAAVAPGSPDAVSVHGTVLQADGEPFAYPDCLLELWAGELWARTRTDPAGGFRAVLRKPPASETPEGEPLAPHLNVVVFGRGMLKQAHTRMYFPDEAQANARDAILRLVPESRRHTLMAEADGDGLRFDIRLQGDDETVFFGFGTA
jgi:protocatechuate 3,4-dioxygenase alpha subunit